MIKLQPSKNYRISFPSQIGSNIDPYPPKYGTFIRSEPFDDEDTMDTFLIFRVQNADGTFTEINPPIEETFHHTKTPITEVYTPLFVDTLFNLASKKVDPAATKFFSNRGGKRSKKRSKRMRKRTRRGPTRV